MEGNGLLRINQRYTGIIRFASQMSHLVRGIEKRAIISSNTVKREGRREEEGDEESIEFLKTFLLS